MKPLVVAFVTDLMFQMRIESTVEKIGCRVQFLENSGQIISGDEEGETSVDPDSEFVDQISRIEPSLIVFDLGNTQIPWAEWITVLKTAPATQHIPVICYGSHVDVDTMKEARQTGADEVLARSRFVTAMPGLFQKHLHLTDLEGKPE